jgi:hypothetical protein
VGLGRLLVELDQELARPPRRVGLDTDRRHAPTQLVDVGVHVDGLAGGLAHELGHRGSPPRRGEVEVATLVGDGRGATQLRRKPRHQLLDQHRQVPIVRVRLVELEHRELGIVARG